MLKFDLDWDFRVLGSCNSSPGLLLIHWMMIFHTLFIPLSSCLVSKPNYVRSSVSWLQWIETCRRACR